MTVAMELTLSGGVLKGRIVRVEATCEHGATSNPYFAKKFVKKTRRSAGLEEVWCLLSGHSVLKMLGTVLPLGVVSQGKTLVDMSHYFAYDLHCLDSLIYSEAAPLSAGVPNQSWQGLCTGSTCTC